MKLFKRISDKVVCIDLKRCFGVLSNKLSWKLYVYYYFIYINKGFKSYML